jgi:hypothetical protein
MPKSAAFSHSHETHLNHNYSDLWVAGWLNLGKCFPRQPCVRSVLWSSLLKAKYFKGVYTSSLLVDIDVYGLSILWCPQGITPIVMVQNSACRLGSPTSSAAAVAPGNWPPNARPQGLFCLVAPDDSTLLALLFHGCPQLAIQCQETFTTHLSKHQAPAFTILQVPRGFPLHRAWRSSTPHCSWQQESSHSPIKEW